jgi:hypothetical protein
MKMIKLYFAGQITSKMFHNYGPDHRGNVYLDSYHFKPFSHRNDFTTIYTIHPDTFRHHFEYNRSKKVWQASQRFSGFYVDNVVNLDNIYLKKEYIRNF